jgi:hypothetical protein
MRFSIESDLTGGCFEGVEQRLLHCLVPSIIAATWSKFVNRRYGIVVPSIPALRLCWLRVAPLEQLLHRGRQTLAELREKV